MLGALRSGCVRQSGLGQASLAQTAKIFAARPAPTLTAIARYSNFLVRYTHDSSDLPHPDCLARYSNFFVFFVL